MAERWEHCARRGARPLVLLAFLSLASPACGDSASPPSQPLTTCNGLLFVTNGTRRNGSLVDGNAGEWCWNTISSASSDGFVLGDQLACDSAFVEPSNSSIDLATLVIAAPVTDYYGTLQIVYNLPDGHTLEDGTSNITGAVRSSLNLESEELLPMEQCLWDVSAGGCIGRRVRRLQHATSNRSAMVRLGFVLLPDLSEALQNQRLAITTLLLSQEALLVPLDYSYRYDSVVLQSLSATSGPLRTTDAALQRGSWPGRRDSGKVEPGVRVAEPPRDGEEEGEGGAPAGTADRRERRRQRRGLQVADSPPEGDAGAVVESPDGAGSGAGTSVSYVPAKDAANVAAAALPGSRITAGPTGRAQVTLPPLRGAPPTAEARPPPRFVDLPPPGDAQLASAAGTAGQPVTSTAGGTLASQAPWIEGSSATPSRPTLPPLADATSSPPALHRTPPQPAGEASPGARAARRRAAREQASAALTNALDGEPAQGVAAGPAPEALAKAAVPVPAPVPAPSSPTADSVRARRAARAQAAAALP
ncbi:hypothetical protein EMIHUDRAFT_222984 [Emiliania huxleyi CCMP1516]|uniref:Uncharacterized protein n=2 Tax=Emiliania huxleyi TaxID=2903 RepID=A0A0D3KWJ6_EMIH1|nr:hypothetical protein EMIHUDRAFT_222984 [Emiliania huxleyi CCMP1516]EOD40131.1 hypothetical protein EMIHUDRAFT_222984 [Emiliania huxleyi CCMP1516]|eukprot:XP_005792560.1 hypothetical protein EMIHUDRAFT_222984 [Emiliania huxleyi CCMP1516]